MRHYLPFVGLPVMLSAASVVSAATVSADIVTAVQSPVPAGSTVPYEIRMVITNPAVEADPLGLCMFSLNLQSNLGGQQPPVQSFSLGIASGFTTIPQQFGTPNSDGGVSGISAAQNCDTPTTPGVGLLGDTLIASGELLMPDEPGQYTVGVFPDQVVLISSEGGSEAPTSVEAGALNITVGEALDGGEEGQDGTEGSVDAGTDGADGGGTADGSGGAEGGGDNATGGDTDTNGTGFTAGQVLSGGPAEADPTTRGLCGFGMFGAVIALAAFFGLWLSRSAVKPR